MTYEHKLKCVIVLLAQYFDRRRFSSEIIIYSYHYYKEAHFSFKLPVITFHNILCSNLQYDIDTCTSIHVRAIWEYFNIFLIIYMDCKCHLHCVNYFLSSLQNILLIKFNFNNSMKINMNLWACCFKIKQYYTITN
jgi:hypothetical protein